MKCETLSYIPDANAKKCWPENIFYITILKQYVHASALRSPRILFEHRLTHAKCLNVVAKLGERQEPPQSAEQASQATRCCRSASERERERKKRERERERERERREKQDASHP